MFSKVLRRSARVATLYGKFTANIYRAPFKSSLSRESYVTCNHIRSYTTEAEDEDLKKSAAKISEMFMKAQKYPEIGQQLQKIQSLFIEKGLVDPANATKKLSWSAQMKMLTDKDIRGAFMAVSYTHLTLPTILLV